MSSAMTFHRDKSTKALLNTDSTELRRYKAEKAREARITQLERMVKELQTTLSCVNDRIDSIMTNCDRCSSP